jgi:hypothetical protein
LTSARAVVIDQSIGLAGFAGPREGFVLQRQAFIDQAMRFAEHDVRRAAIARIRSIKR